MLFQEVHYWIPFSKTPFPLRPFIGGIILALVLFYGYYKKFMGLGVPAIVDKVLRHQRQC
jgi:hypothetical protein